MVGDYERAVLKAMEMGKTPSEAKEIAKHLLGRHDQKDHGKKGNPKKLVNFSQGHSRSEHTKEDYAQSALKTYVGAYAGVAGGVMLMAVAPKMMSVVSVKSLKSIPSTIADAPKYIKETKQAKAGFDAMSDLDQAKLFATYLNEGKAIPSWMKNASPQAKALSKEISAWTSGGQAGIRRAIVEGSEATSDGYVKGAALSNAIAMSDEAPKLYRGMKVKGEPFTAMTTPGNTFHLGPTGFSKKQNVAEKFAHDAYGEGGQIIFEMDNARALNLQPEAGPLFAQEAEWLTAGRFRVVSATKDAKGATRVKLEQVDLHIPKVNSAPSPLKSYGEQVEIMTLINQKMMDDYHKGFVTSPAFDLSAVGGPKIVGSHQLNKYDFGTVDDLFTQKYGAKWWSERFGIPDKKMQDAGIHANGWMKLSDAQQATVSQMKSPVEHVLALRKSRVAKALEILRSR